MKKLTSLLLCMVLVLSLFCVNAAAAGIACMEAGVTVSDEGTVTVVVTGKLPAANARLTVDFDAERLSYTGCETGFAVHSVRAEDGLLTIGLASASADALGAGDELVKLSFAPKGDAAGAKLVVTAETYGGKPVRESVTLEVGKAAVIAEGWSGYTLWKLTDDGVLTVSPSGNLYNGKCNMKHYWKVGGVLTLPWSAYAEQITKVVVEEGVDSVGQMTFYELPNLREVVLADSVDEIYGYAFKNDTALTAVNLDNVHYIRQGAFYGCTGLEVVNLPEGAVVEEWAFAKVPGYDAGR